MHNSNSSSLHYSSGSLRTSSSNRGDHEDVVNRVEIVRLEISALGIPRHKKSFAIVTLLPNIPSEQPTILGKTEV
jgi:hypothetical protein